MTTAEARATGVGPRRLPVPAPGGPRRLPRRAGRAPRPARTRRAAPAPGGLPGGLGRQALPRGVLLLGVPRRPAHRPRAGPRGAGCCAPAAALEILHASALAHDDYMDASDTRRGHPVDPPRLRGRAPRRRWAGDPEQYGAAAAILLGDLLLSWADELLRRCGFPLTAGRARARPLRPVPLRGDHRPVPRRLGAGARCRRRRRRDAGAALQVREVLRREAAAHRRRPRGGHAGGPRRPDRRRAAARRGLPAPRRPARGLRRPVGHREAGRGRPRGGQAHGARGPGARRRRAPRTPRCSTASLGTPLDGADGDPAARDHRRVRRARPGRGAPSPRSPTARSRRWTGPGSTPGPAPSCARWRPPPPTAPSERRVVSRGW